MAASDVGAEDQRQQPQLYLQQQELAEFCISREWSKAIKILTSLLSHHPDSVNLLCNRAFCHNKLDLHKHAIKDCEKAMQINKLAFQAYIHKGHALVGLGRQKAALQVWKEGYESAVNHLGNIELLLELHMLMMNIQKEDNTADGQKIEGTVLLPSEEFLSSPPSTPKTPPRQSKSMQIDEKRKTTAVGIGDIKTKRTSQLISWDMRLSRGVGMVNSGQYQQAVAIFDQVIRDSPNSVDALLGRGTAYAFQRNLNAAILDFSKALQVNPQTGEAWKRRGQARAALGSNIEAISDLSKALEFEPNSSDILHERGVARYRSKDYEGAMTDLEACVLIDPSNKFAYNYLGLSLLGIGQHTEAINAHYKALNLDPNFKEGWTQLAQSFSELGNSDKAMECLQKVLSIDEKYVVAHRLLGLMLKGLGDHRGAIKELTAGLEQDPANLECKYLRGSCHHAVGEYADAVRDYDGVLEMEADSMEKCLLQILAFYQRVVSLYTASKANHSFSLFDIDHDLHPSVKESWCKRLSPTMAIASFCTLPPIKESLKSGRLRGHDFVKSKAKKLLLDFADELGCKIQYHCPGFLKSKRQHRMAGLAALEIAQKVLGTWKAMRDPGNSQEKPAGSKFGKRIRRRESIGIISNNRGGICTSSNGTDSSTTHGFHEDKSVSRLILNWQGVYTIAVKWRQISEPCDPVVWVNKLSEDEFNSGFGSHTPMLLGQARVVRYYPNFQRAFSILKNLMISNKCVYNAASEPVAITTSEQLKSIKDAETLSQLYDILGQDFWVVTPCYSTADPGKVLDGTRLILQKSAEHGFDFSIRTPGTPARWAEFDHEMTSAWEALCDTYCWETYGVMDINLLEKIRDCILKLSFYWYNFMPLARGTAAVGYVTLLGLFLAAGMRVTADIPKDVQVDWEAILSPNVDMFMESIRPWLYSSVKAEALWQSLPDVASTFPTTGSVVAALSSYDVD